MGKYIIGTCVKQTKSADHNGTPGARYIRLQPYSYLHSLLDSNRFGFECPRVGFRMKEQKKYKDKINFKYHSLNP